LSRSSNLAAIDLATGHPSSWTNDTNGQVWALTTDGTSLYASGFFTTVQNITRHYIAKLNIATGSVDAFDPSPSDVVTCMSLDGLGRLYIGGYFLSVPGGGGHTLACVDATTGAVLPFLPTTFGGPVNSVVAVPAYNLVVAASQGGMWAFNTSNSSTVWTESMDPNGIGGNLLGYGAGKWPNCIWLGCFGYRYPFNGYCFRNKSSIC